jgi:hypothetical protein
MQPPTWKEQVKGMVPSLTRFCKHRVEEERGDENLPGAVGESAPQWTPIYKLQASNGNASPNPPHHTTLFSFTYTGQCLLP